LFLVNEQRLIRAVVRAAGIRLADERARPWRNEFERGRRIAPATRRKACTGVMRSRTTRTCAPRSPSSTRS
jgi:hypothetical protein